MVFEMDVGLQPGPILIHWLTGNGNQTQTLGRQATWICSFLRKPTSTHVHPNENKFNTLYYMQQTSCSRNSIVQDV